MKYEVTKPFGGYRMGQIVDDSSRYIRRKIQEGGCLREVDSNVLLNKKKMKKQGYENKSIGGE